MRIVKAESSKANNRGLASACVLLSLILMPQLLLAGDILMDSGPDRDTVIQVGPDAEFLREERQAVRFETDEDNSSIIRTRPVDRPGSENPQPVFITPEIHMDIKQ